MSLDVVLLEPYYGGSHQSWIDGYQTSTRHNLLKLTLPAQAWKWRMQGGAISLARLFNESGAQPDLILASDMMDLSIFRAITREKTHDIPHALYFHENQLTYPQNSRQNHGWRYGFINYASAMSADAVFFNSQFHLEAFFEALPKMLKHFYDYNELETVDGVREKSSVLPLGLDLRRFDTFRTAKELDSVPLIVWNHRWEEDKNPHLFLHTMYRLLAQKVPFRVAIVGENVRHRVPEFEQAHEQLGEHLVQLGYIESFANYAKLLWQADYVVSTANQEFFGGAIAEAIYCGCVPLLPHRLNYPHLLPHSAYDACLYRDDKLLPLLMSHLQGEIIVEMPALQKHVAHYDWLYITPQYDAALAHLV